MIRRVVLQNGIRVVTERMASVRSVSLGIWLPVGSRHESASEHGLSHFIEHMFFKGTASRTAKALAQEMDQLGGEMNAYTTRDTTTFHIRVLDTDLPKAVEILSDVFHHSLFGEREIAREKRVVIEEIKMVEDDPEEQIHDLHLQAIWPDDALGRPVQGTAGAVARFTRRDLLGFIRRHYRPDRLVIAAAGNLEPRTLHRLVAKAFGGDSPARRSQAPAPSVRSQTQAAPGRQVPPGLMMRGGLFLTPRRLEQVHLCLSLPGLRDTHPDRYALAALSVLLGGGSSSRLFQEVREARGLAYSISSSLSSFVDTGVLSVYAAASVPAVPRVLRIALREIRRLKTNGPAPQELARAKRQMTGALMFGMESTSHRMSKLALEELCFGRGFTLEEIRRAIQVVSRSQVRRVARDLFDERRLAVSVLGPISHRALRPALPALLGRRRRA